MTQGLGVKIKWAETVSRSCAIILLCEVVECEIWMYKKQVWNKEVCVNGCYMNLCEREGFDCEDRNCKKDDGNEVTHSGGPESLHCVGQLTSCRAARRDPGRNAPGEATPGVLGCPGTIARQPFYHNGLLHRQLHLLHLRHPPLL